ncbi:MAG: CPBP family intramembrane metalloprotease [Actinomycetota bacterium]|nr:CPBP family intramembrane metalloprotease [Actinomycetota bacterium]
MTDPAERRSLVWETRFVMAAFLVPGVSSAIVIFSQAVGGGTAQTRFPEIVPNLAANLVLGAIAYLPVAAVVPLAVFLLARSGQSPASLGLVRPSFKLDVVPGIGLAAASFAAEFAAAVALAPVLDHATTAINQVSTGHFPGYYVVLGLFMSAVTAVTEEVLVNGYLLTRLGQLGWAPWPAFFLSLALRTSYHVYYGLGFVFTIPFGYFVTRSFQKHGRLGRPIAAHFIYDGVLITIAVLTAH